LSSGYTASHLCIRGIFPYQRKIPVFSSFDQGAGRVDFDVESWDGNRSVRNC
jgi:hypothetical protein